MQPVFVHDFRVQRLVFQNLGSFRTFISLSSSIYSLEFSLVFAVSFIDLKNQIGMFISSHSWLKFLLCCGSQLGAILPSEDIWQNLETFVAVMT